MVETGAQLRENLSVISGELPDTITADYELLSCYQYAEKKQTYLIQRKTDNRKMILKCARGEYLPFLREEAEFLKDRKFSFLPCYMSYYESDGSAFLFREYIEGSTIWDIVEKHGPFEQKEALAILKKTAAMLKMLHAEVPPVIYRDLKPQNIVVTSRGECYLIDVGTVRQYADDKQQDTVVVGTRMAAAPEQFGYSQTDERTDIYAFGILMNYMLTGSMKADNRKNVGNPIIKSDLQKIILKCTAFSPEQRYQKVSQIEKQIDRLMQYQGKRHKTMRAARAVLITAACLVCLVFGAGKIKENISSEVRFEDMLLETAVRNELGKNQEEKIYVSDLVNVDQLIICGDEVISDYDSHRHYMKTHWINDNNVEGRGTIQDISLLQKMPNLKILVLDNQKLTDISPLKNLDLQIVSLCGNRISDISPLQNSASLLELYIAETQVSDISVLADKKALRVLDISYTFLSSVEPLRGLKIGELSMFDVTPEDYTVLGELPLLWKLEIRDVPSDGLEVIAGIESLERITIYSSNITSLDLFARLSNLKYLDLWSNNVRNLDGIGNLPNIAELNVGENPITEIKIPPQIHLNFLGIRDSGVSDLSFLKDMPYLKNLDVNYNQKQLLEELMPNPPFSVNVYS